MTSNGEAGPRWSPPTAFSTGAQAARQRQALYRLFGSLFLYPDAERLTTLRSVGAELLHEGDFWRGYDYSAAFAELLQELALLPQGESIPIEEEYNRLFTVKPAAPPYESIYVDPQRKTVGLLRVQLEHIYAAAGLSLTPALREPSDHVAVELEFMAFLCDKEATGWEQNAIDAWQQYRERQCAFLERHLGRWFGRFAHKVRDAEPIQIYVQAIEACEAFLRLELDPQAAKV